MNFNDNNDIFLDDDLCIVSDLEGQTKDLTELVEQTKKIINEEIGGSDE